MYPIIYEGHQYLSINVGSRKYPASQYQVRKLDFVYKNTTVRLTF